MGNRSLSILCLATIISLIGSLSTVVIEESAAFTLKVNAVCSGSKVGDRWVLTAKHCDISFLDKIALGHKKVTVCGPPISFGEDVDLVLLEVWTENAKKDWDGVSEVDIGTLHSNWDKGLALGFRFGETYPFVTMVGIEEVDIKECKKKFLAGNEDFPVFGFCGEELSSVASIVGGMSGGPFLVGERQVGVTVANKPLPAFVSLTEFADDIEQSKAVSDVCQHAYRESRYILAESSLR